MTQKIESNGFEQPKKTIWEKFKKWIITFIVLILIPAFIALIPNVLDMEQFRRQSIPTHTPVNIVIPLSTATNAPLACSAKIEITPIGMDANSDNRYPTNTLLNLIGEGECPFPVNASRFSNNGELFGEDSGLENQAEQIRIISGESQLCFHITYGAWEVGTTDCVDVLGYEEE